MEQAITILIYFHAFCGGIGLLTGIGSIIVRKGGLIHKRMGRIFSYAMLTSSSIALVVSRMPNHENLFLFLIALFTIYLVLAGNRALTFKSRSKKKANVLDKSVSGVMLFSAVIMIIFGVIGYIQNLPNSILYVFFGGFGAFLSLGDFRMFKIFHLNKNAWLISHLGRMTGALIASITAFLVTAIDLGSVVVWIAPTLVGTLYITYWNVKLKSKKGTF